MEIKKGGIWEEKKEKKRAGKKVDRRSRRKVYDKDRNMKIKKR